VAELLHSVKSLKITNLDYSELLKDTNEGTFLFLDPPYDIKDNLYGDKGNMHRGFDHLKFSNDIKEVKTPWMITYNDNEILKQWFSDYRCISWDLQYTMKAAKREGQVGSTTTGKSGKKGKELLIMNWS
jgi:DNA adenine methylase